MSRLSDNYPPGYSEDAGPKYAAGEFAFLDLIEFLRMLEAISQKTYVQVNYNEDFEGENYN